MGVKQNGYERSEVDAHSGAVEAAVEDPHGSQAPESAATVAADHVKQISDVASTAVREIVEAAERSGEEIRSAASAEASATRESAERDATELRRRADDDARRLTERSKRESRELLEQAQARAAAHLETVAAARSLLERFGVSAGSLLAELDAFDRRGGDPAETPAPGAVAWRAKDDAVAAADPDAASAEDGAGEAEAGAGEAEAGAGEAEAGAGDAGSEARRAQKLNMTAFEMVIKGTPREEIAARLTKEFELEGADDDLLERTLQQATVSGANWRTERRPPLRRRFLRR